MGMWSIKAQHMVCVTSSEWCFCLCGVWQCPSRTLLGWSVWSCCCWLKQLESTALDFGKQMKNNKKCFILCFFHSIIGLWKDLERLCFAWSSECISAVCLGWAEQGCMIDYILPNMYILCVIMYFQRISEHTALEQMCTVEAGQNSNEVPSQSLNVLQRVFYHSERKVEGCTVFKKSSCLFGLKKKKSY